MTLAEAIKKNLAIEITHDVYLLATGRILKYDRYYMKPRSRRVSNMWIDEKGNVFHNFSDAYGCVHAYKWA